MGELQAIAHHGLSRPADAPNHGRPPRMDWLALDLLRIDPSYQRPVTARGVKTIDAIVRAFTWAKFSPLIVNPVPGPDGIFTIIDGQHRASAALICGYDRVPCSIVDVSQADAAQIFAAVNGTVTPMTVQHLYKASLVAGVEWACAVKRATDAAGIEALFHPVPKNKMKPFQTIAIGSLRQLVERFGEVRLGETLARAARQPGADVPGYFNSDRIRAPFYGALDSRNHSKPAAAPGVPPRLAGPQPDLAEAIRKMKARGHGLQYIAATLKVNYAVIEAALKEGV